MEKVTLIETLIGLAGIASIVAIGLLRLRASQPKAQKATTR